MRNAKGYTHTGYVRGAVYKNEEAHVLFFTGMTMERLFDMKVDMGKRWVTVWAKGYGLTEADAAEIWEYEEVRQVWNNEWRRMDHYGLMPVLYKLPPGEALNVYNDMHTEVFLEENPYYLWLEMGMGRAMKRIMKNGG